MVYYKRKLPHWQPPGKNLFVTWRLNESLPAKVLEALRAKQDLSEGKRFVEFDRHLDSASHGPLWLNDAKLATMVVEAFHKVAADGLCKIHAYVVMPNHVHILLEPISDLTRITQLIKGRTARYGNQILNRTGHFWQSESFDHWIRDSAQFDCIRTYIEQNPVKARLVQHPEDWNWSSAGSTVARPLGCNRNPSSRRGNDNSPRSALPEAPSDSDPTLAD